MNADTLANMTPIARIPEKGNSGWALQLTKDGGLIFRIGSKENHHDVLVSEVYQPHKDCFITCIFDRGTAQVFVSGKRLKIENGIRQETKDVSTAGRLGDVGEQLQVIADVFIPTKNDASKDNLQQKTITRYKGNLQHIRVFNRAVTSDEILKFKN